MIPMERTCLPIIAAAATLLAALATGCALKMHSDLVELDGLESCRHWRAEEFAALVESFDHRSRTPTLQCALDMLRRIDSTALHRTAAGPHICLLLAERSTEDGERREKFAAEGVRWAETALLEGAEGDGLVHYYLALNLGLAVREHPALAVKNMKRIEAELKKARELTPDVDHGGPGRTLGMVYLLAPAWPAGIGDGDEALELLTDTVEQHPEHPLNHVFYAQALWELDGEAGRNEVEHHLREGKRLIETGDWGPVRATWLKELHHVAEEADISLDTSS
jgi:hypothetical protein